MATAPPPRFCEGDLERYDGTAEQAAALLPGLLVGLFGRPGTA